MRLIAHNNNQESERGSWLKADRKKQGIIEKKEQEL
jgi:hypothetical protein